MLWVTAVYLYFHMYHGFSAATRGKGLPISVGDDGSTFCGTIANGIGELYAMEELFNFLIEGSTSDDDFIETSAKRLIDG